MRCCADDRPPSFPWDDQVAESSSHNVIEPVVDFRMIFSGHHMRYRGVASIGVVVGFAAFAPLLQPIVVAQTRPAAKPWSAPRTADGHPDLQGNWSFATITPFERPQAFADKAVLSDKEVAEYEKEQAARANQDDNRQIGTLADVNRAYN